VLADPDHADSNRAVLSGWIGKWTADSTRAAKALAPLFGTTSTESSEKFDICLNRALENQQAILAGCGLAAGDA
jgi:hypothetical protein